VDAVHARPDERAAVEAVAREMGVGFEGVWLEAPEAELIRRVAARTGDASDADAAVVRAQLTYDLGEIGWRRTASPVSSEPGASPSDRPR
jgi:predicted kinase